MVEREGSESEALHSAALDDNGEHIVLSVVKIIVSPAHPCPMEVRRTIY